MISPLHMPDDSWERPIPNEPADGHDGPDAVSSQTTEDQQADLFRLAIANAASRAVDGAQFILDQTADIDAIWGDSERCLWARGESLLICGPEGVGKTTVAQQLTLRRLGIGGTTFLGFDVAATASRVLYLASDRPTQARRSMARMVSETDRDVLAERLQVWAGPIPHDIGKTPEALLHLARWFGADTIVIDSLKDIALDLSKDETGSRVNAAFQAALAEGIDIAALHHQRKAQAGAGKPKSIADIFGSRWITAGAGSVLMLWGEAGDAVIELSHLKQPLEDVGPLQLLHDHHAGTTTIVGQVDAYTLVQAAVRGVTASEVAIATSGNPTPDRNTVEKARRRLETLVRAGHAHKIEGSRGGSDGGEPARYCAVTSRSESTR